MGPPPRSLAAEANGCFMVRVRRGPNRIQGCGARDAPDSGLPSDQSKHASTIGEQSDAIKLDTDIPIQGCVKTPRSFPTLVVLVCFLGLRSIRSRKIAKIFGCAIVRIFSTTFYTASVELTHSARPRAMTGICAKETAWNRRKPVVADRNIVCRCLGVSRLCRLEVESEKMVVNLASSGPSFIPPASPLCAGPRRAARCTPTMLDCRPTTTAVFSVGRWLCW
jgi:hypothetical protein